MKVDILETIIGRNRGAPLLCHPQMCWVMLTDSYSRCKGLWAADWTHQEWDFVFFFLFSHPCFGLIAKYTAAWFLGVGFGFLWTSLSCNWKCWMCLRRIKVKELLSEISRSCLCSVTHRLTVVVNFRRCLWSVTRRLTVVVNFRHWSTVKTGRIIVGL